MIVKNTKKSPKTQVWALELKKDPCWRCISKCRG